MSPWLFNIFMVACMRAAKITNTGVEIDDFRIYRLLYADDTVLLSESESELQSMLSRMNEMCRKFRLSINGAKTKVMVFERGVDDTECKVSLNGLELDQVNEF